MRAAGRCRSSSSSPLRRSSSGLPRLDEQIPAASCTNQGLRYSCPHGAPDCSCPCHGRDLLRSARRRPRPPLDWNALRAEILDRYRALVRIDSVAGRETLVVDYLKKVLEAEGIPTRPSRSIPTRANLVARLKGNGSKRPLLILAHTDVVGVQREKWPVDPFGAVLKDGYIWGRGSKDDKPVLAANLMTMLLLKRRGVPLDRDVIFLAESGEEADTPASASTSWCASTSTTSTPSSR